MIKMLKVEKFRAMENLDIPLGSKITVIAGQNATCKSTQLGMLGQPFGLKNEKTIFGKSFSTKFSDIFRWSEVNDVPGTHSYSIEFCDDKIFGKKIEYVKSYQRKDSPTHIRLVAGKTRNKGEGNLELPVIYLGLKRVYPIGELADIQLDTPDLTVEEISLFKDLYKKVFFPNEEFEPVKVAAKLNKESLVINSEDYDYLANSAGQDNVGQLLGALLSFKRLQKKLGVDYKGGLLLIDELDATLFPGAQINLINLLYKFAKDLKLQIVFTTHSLEAIEHIISRPKQKNDTKVLYFTKVHGPLEMIEDPSIERIRGDILMKVSEQTKFNKINVYCEDAEAAWFSKKLLGSKRAKFVNFSKATFGGNFLHSISQKKIPEFDQSILILDGDKQIKGKSNLINLPGGLGKMNPENLLRTHLESLDPSDVFWVNDLSYTKQVFQKNLNDITHGQYGNRELMKKWFETEKSYWGKGGANIYKSWLQKNEKPAQKFVDDFETAYNNIAKTKSIPLMNE